MTRERISQILGITAPAILDAAEAMVARHIDRADRYAATIDESLPGRRIYFEREAIMATLAKFRDLWLALAEEASEEYPGGGRVVIHHYRDDEERH